MRSHWRSGEGITEGETRELGQEENVFWGKGRVGGGNKAKKLYIGGDKFGIK